MEDTTESAYTRLLKLRTTLDAVCTDLDEIISDILSDIIMSKYGSTVVSDMEPEESEEADDEIVLPATPQITEHPNIVHGPVASQMLNPYEEDDEDEDDEDEDDATLTPAQIAALEKFK